MLSRNYYLRIATLVKFNYNVIKNETRSKFISTNSFRSRHNNIISFLPGNSFKLNGFRNLSLKCSTFQRSSLAGLENYDDNQQFNNSDNDFTEIGKWTEAQDVLSTQKGDFANFNMSSHMTEKLKEKGITYLFPVQSNTYMAIHNGHDVIVQARTGSGKTLSYAIPLLEKLNSLGLNRQSRLPKMLVLTPTRELSHQVSEVITSINDKLTVLSVYGGTSISNQEFKLHKGVDIVVGTPGRIMDLMERGSLNLKDLNHVVLDEVDRMLDMGFADDVEKILKARYSTDNVENNPQTLLFSATVPSWVQKTAKKYLSDDLQMIDLVGRGTVKTAVCVKHLALMSSPQGRVSVISDLINKYGGDDGRVIIFCQTKREVDRLAQHKTLIQHNAQMLHGDVPQTRRESVLKGFRDGKFSCLIATDVASRGLDIPEVDLVIQCSPPQDVDSYIHRSGRTGRAGRPGVCVLLYTPSEKDEITRVQKIAGFKFEKATIEKNIELQLDNAIKSITNVPERCSNKYESKASELLNKFDSVKLLSSAIALIANCDQMQSLITFKEGYTTFQYTAPSYLQNKIMAWKNLSSLLSENLSKDITNVNLCSDKKSCVFDIPLNQEDNLLNEIKLINSVKALEILPELDDQQESHLNKYQNGQRSFNNHSYGNRNNYNSMQNGYKKDYDYKYKKDYNNVTNKRDYKQKRYEGIMARNQDFSD